MSIILLIHIASMSASLLASAGILMASVASLRVNNKIITGTTAATSIGVITGIALLSLYPLDLKCAALLSYTFGFIALRRYVSKRNQLVAISES